MLLNDGTIKTTIHQTVTLALHIFPCFAVPCCFEPSDVNREVVVLAVWSLCVVFLVVFPTFCWPALSALTKLSAGKTRLHFSICTCHPCARVVLIFSVSFQEAGWCPKGIHENILASTFSRVTLEKRKDSVTFPRHSLDLQWYPPAQPICVPRSVKQPDLVFSRTVRKARTCSCK